MARIRFFIDPSKTDEEIAEAIFQVVKEQGFEEEGLKTMANFGVIWRRIEQHAGEVFVQTRGGQFTYYVQDGAVHPDRTNRILPRSQFERACERMPVSGPGELQDLQGPSYLWAILTDRRIRQGLPKSE